MLKIPIPEQFVLSPYFEGDEELPINTNYSFEQLIDLQPLVFDLYEMLHIESIKPWQEKDHYIPKLIDKWERTKPTITYFFTQRDRKQALLPMKNMIMTFLTFLFWVNDQPVPELKNVGNHLKQLHIKPVNAEERLAYILKFPNHHHAFTQLDQLFIELQKKYAVAKIKR